MLTNTTVEKVHVPDSLSDLDQLSRLRRHGCSPKDGNNSNNGSGGNRGGNRPSSAPTTGIRKMIKMGGANSKTTKKKPQVILDFPPKTSAVNAVQRIILGKYCCDGGNIAVYWHS